MARRVARLTLDNLPDLVGPCSSCVFWQLDPVSRGRVAGMERVELSAWLSEVLREWGSCGRILYVDDQPAGHVIYAPAVHVPGADQFPTAPVSPDAVLLLQARVDPSYAGGGLGRVLVQAMAKDLIKRGDIRAVEAFGHTGGSTRKSCVLPADFLLGVGFRTHRAHDRYPRMRMDLRSVLTWREELEAALDRLISAGRGPVPAPANPPAARNPVTRDAQPATPAPDRPEPVGPPRIRPPRIRPPKIRPPKIRPEGAARPL